MTRHTIIRALLSHSHSTDCKRYCANPLSNANVEDGLQIVKTLVSTDYTHNRRKQYSRQKYVGKRLREVLRRSGHMFHGSVCVINLLSME